MEALSDESEDLSLPINFWRGVQEPNPLQQCNVSELPQLHTDTSVAGQPNRSHGTTIKIVRKRKSRKGPIKYSDTDSSDDDIPKRSNTKVRTKCRKENVLKDRTIKLHHEADIDAGNKTAKKNKYDSEKTLHDFEPLQKTDCSHDSQSFSNNTNEIIGTGDAIAHPYGLCNPSINKIDNLIGTSERKHNFAENATNFEKSTQDKDNGNIPHCEDKNIISEITSGCSDDDIDNSEMEKSFYTCQKKLKISRSRFGAFRRKNYKYGPLIFSDDETKTKETNDKCKITKTNCVNKDSAIITAKPSPLESGITRDVVSVTSTNNSTNTKIDFGAQPHTTHQSAQKVKCMHLGENGVDVTDEPHKYGHYGSNDKKNTLSHLDAINSKKKMNRDASPKTIHAVNTMNELFFGEESHKIKPAPGRRKIIRSADIMRHEVNITKSPERHEVTLLDDNSLWSSPKR